MHFFLFFLFRHASRCAALPGEASRTLQTFPLTKCSPSTFVPLGHAFSPFPLPPRSRRPRETFPPPPPRETRQVRRRCTFVYPATSKLRFAVSHGSRGRPTRRKNGGRVRGTAPGGTWRDSGFISRKMKIEVESCASRLLSYPSRRWTSAELRIIRRTSGGSTNARLIATM